jgi:hypothetical protein
MHWDIPLMWYKWNPPCRNDTKLCRFFQILTCMQKDCDSSARVQRFLDRTTWTEESELKFEEWILCLFSAVSALWY